MSKKKTSKSQSSEADWRHDLGRDLDRIQWQNRYAEETGIEPATLHAERLAYKSELTPNEETMDPFVFAFHGDKPSDETKRVLNELRRKYAEQEAAKRVAGRYTLEEAAERLAEAGERYERMLGKLVDAARDGTLPMYGPGEQARYEYDSHRLPDKPAQPGYSSSWRATHVRTFYEESYAGDLNAWLAEHERQITYRFPVPSQPGRDDEASPLPRQKAQELSILAALQKLQFDPLHLPKPKKRGKMSPAKQAAREALTSWSDEIFRKAWQRLRKRGEIADA